MSIASLYPSINPSLLLDFANSKVLDSRVTFTRTTTATYYDGVTTAKAEENLLVDSQEFNNWSKYNSTVTSNTSTAPDGTTTADTLVDNSTNSWHIVERSGPGVAGVYTYSAYIKAGTLGFGCVTVLTDTQGNGYGVVINLSTGAVTSTLTYYSPVGASYTVTSVGSGWYRVAITITNTSGFVQAYVATSNSGTPSSNLALPTYVGSGGTILMWGAQLEQRSSATAYTATTSQAITNYIPVLQTAAAGQARFDHNPTTGESLGLLIEEARTNLLLRSQDLSNAAWGTKSGTFLANAAIAPDGTQTATMITAIDADPYVYQSVSLSATTYTLSVWVRALGNTIGKTGTMRGGSNISSALTMTGAWQRLTYTFTQGSSATTNVGFEFPDVGGVAGDMVLFWGAQLEAGSFATSYIPTVASSVTRNADAANMTGTNFSSWFNGGAGTFYSEFLPYLVTGNGGAMSANDGTANNRIDLRRDGNSIITTAGVGQAEMFVSGMTANASNRLAVGYALNNFALVRNGGAVTTDASGTVPLGINVLNIGNLDSGSYFLNGTIKKVSYYPIRVTNAQLQALTV